MLKYLCGLLLSTLLIGCSPKVEYIYVATPIYPPLVYLEPVPEPKLKGKTNNDLAKYIFSLRTAIAEGNHHKLKIQQWIQEQETINQEKK
jgi:hypothetical protein